MIVKPRGSKLPQWLLLLAGLVLLSACSDRKEEAKEALLSVLPQKRDVEYRELVEYPGGAVCGEYDTVDPMRGSSRYHPFVVWGGTAEDRPTAEDLAIFCNRDAEAALLATLGIGPLEAPENQLQQIRGDMRLIEAALEEYQVDNHFLPSTAQGLGALLSPAEIPPKPTRFRDGGYLPQLPEDPWGRPYQYERSGLGGIAHDYRIFTLGADGTAGGSGKDADVSSKHLKYLDYIDP
jgi:general secretion pathway protein G